MILSEAIKLRINELLKENDLTAYQLSYKAGIYFDSFFIIYSIF